MPVLGRSLLLIDRSLFPHR
jgi:hypothetical protein